MGARKDSRISIARPCDGLSGVGMLWWGVALAAAIFGPRVGLLGSDDPNYRFFTTVLPLFVWALAYFVFMCAPIALPGRLATIIGFALFGFLLQDTINFASIVPATLTTAFALLAVLVAVTHSDDSPVGNRCHTGAGRHIPKPSVAAGAPVVVVILFAVGMLRPVWRANAALQEARTAPDPMTALRFYEEAAASDKWDPTAHHESAQLLRVLAMQGVNAAYSIGSAIEHIDAAIARDPQNVSLYREKTRCHRLRAQRFDSPKDRSAAVAAARTASRLYPTNPADHIALGDCLFLKGVAESDSRQLVEALQSYRWALSLDDSRPLWEKIRRLRPSERGEIRSRIAEITSILSHDN